MNKYIESLPDFDINEFQLSRQDRDEIELEVSVVSEIISARLNAELSHEYGA